jgi:hypothetical protein
MILQEKEFPERINVEPTNLCNMRCRLCPHPILQRPRGRIDPALFRRIAGECGPHGTTLWLQYMGEPLLHPEIVRMICDAKQAGVKQVGLSTNASLLDAPMAEQLLASGLDRLECSVDALDAEEFLACRGTDDFSRVERNIEGFLLAKRKRGSARPVTSIQYMAFSLCGEERSARVKARWKDLLGPGDFIMSIEDYSFAGTVRALRRAEKRFPCRWPFRSAVILWDGTLVMCGSDPDGRAPMGDLARQGIREIWQGARFRRVRDLHRSGQWDRLPLCRGCDDWVLSDGTGYVNIYTAGGEGS